MQGDLRSRLIKRLAGDPFGPPVRLVTAPGATLLWERETLAALGGGSLRLRVQTPARLATEVLAQCGEPAAALSHAQLKALLRVVADRKRALQVLGGTEGARAGAESLLLGTLEAAWWQGPKVPEAAAEVLGAEFCAALQGIQDEIVEWAAEAGLAPEPWLLWRAVEFLDRVAWEPASVFWPEGPLRAPEAALRAELLRRGYLADLAEGPGEGPRPGVTVEVRAAPDVRTEARAAARHCLDLVRDGWRPGDILIGCGDFPLQSVLLRAALEEAGIAVDAGPGDVRGEPIRLCLGGFLDVLRGRRQEGLLAIVGSGIAPAPGPLRDSLLGHLRDGRDPSEEAAAFLAQIDEAAGHWPRQGPFEEHRAALGSLLEAWDLVGRLGISELMRQREILRSFGEQLDAVATVAGPDPLERALALRLLEDALDAARPEYQPRGEAVRVVPVGEMYGLEAGHVLLLGLAEGRFPALASSPTLLRAGEIQRCEQRGAPLQEPLAERRRRSLEAVEAALGAATRGLYLSYAEIDAEGGVQAASIRLRQLGEPQPLTPAAPDEVSRVALSRQEAGELLAQAAGRARDIGADAALPFALLAAHAEACGQGAHLGGLAGSPEEERVQAFSGPFTVTALERRAACPFMAFAHDVVRIEPEQRTGFDPAARGALVHQVLRELPELAPPGAAQHGIVAQLVEQAAEQIGVLPKDSPQGRSLRDELAAEVLRTARLVWEEGRRSGFHPAGREVAFGRRGELPALTVRLDDGREVLIEGRIDRLDRLDGWVRVVDYKVRRRQPFSFARVFNGLDLQIGAYALAAAQGGGRPVAMMYWPVRLGQSWVHDEDDDDSDGVWRQQRPQGLFLSDPGLVEALDREEPDGGSPFHPLRRKKDGGLRDSAWALPDARWQSLLRHVERTLGRLAQQAQEGHWAPAPYALGRQTACDGCGLRPACRHVPGRDGYRRLQKTTQEVLDDGAADD